MTIECGEVKAGVVSSLIAYQRVGTVSHQIFNTVGVPTCMEAEMQGGFK